MRPEPPVTLLTGSGSGRLEKAALEEARRILCRRSCPPFAPDPACADCRRVAAREHPDLLIAAPERRRRTNVPGFDEGHESKETTIPTAMVRAVAADASRLPYESARRVLVLLDVEKTEAAAFSALLKTLEEPPLRATFLLTSTRPRHLPSTILSRVALRPLPVTSREETARQLQVAGASAEEAEARAAFAPFDAEAARTLDLAEARSRRDSLLEAVTGTLVSRSAAWALCLAQRLAGDDGPDTADRLVLLAIVLKDAVAATLDPAGRDVVHRERFRDLQRLGREAEGSLLPIAAEALMLAAALADGRRNFRLAVEAFSLGLVA